MNPSKTDNSASIPPNEATGGLLPAFKTKQYSHLPTPQSPNDIGRYVHDGPHSPESPIPYGAISSSLQNQRAGNRRLDVETNRVQTQPISQQCITPESSPHLCHPPHSYYNTSATPRYFIPPSNDFSTPKQNFVKSESATSLQSFVISEHKMSTPSSPSSEQLSHSAALSSPFMSKLSIEEHGTKRNRLPLDSQPSRIDDPFCFSHKSEPILSTSIPAASSPQPSNSKPVSIADGEMERIRQSIVEDRMAQLREAEKRRPEYLKRAKRTSETDPGYLEEEETLNDTGRPLAVGIMESPQKGRRLKLFQETSEESFEESLMAGGYGRYRTADWVRQPQPIALPVSTNAGSSTIVSLLEEAEEAPPSEKEAKKRKRLAAFKFETNTSNTKLCAVELKGKGRVLIDISTEEQNIPGSPEPVPNKKRAGNRRKKRGVDSVVGKRVSASSRDVDDQADKPNWPDTEFPWRLRTEERIELAKAEEEERLRWIERFLDRDSDDEDDAESDMQYGNDATVKYEDIFQQLQTAVPANSMKAKPFPMGRGKMVPLSVYSESTGRLTKHTAFPSDPADARAALLSKKSVRALSYRQQKRQRELDDEHDDEVVCICNGKDDGRELVQCDACQTWYHLECIGIKNIAELGREEDPWFCRRCVVRSPSPSIDASHLLFSEPTFVPTDDQPNVRRPLETSLFPTGLQDSPNWVQPRMPRTPTRMSDPVYSWSDSSRPGPSTPQHSAQSVRIYNSPFDSYSRDNDESPFDPTSTPSRGINFYVPFATPKSTTWLPRANAPLFQTPSKPTDRGSINTESTMLGSHLGILDDANVTNPTSTQQQFSRLIAYDESPIRRNTTTDTFNPRHNLHSPSRSRAYRPNLTFLEESPVVRSLGSHVQQRPTLDDDPRYDHIS